MAFAEIVADILEQHVPFTGQQILELLEQPSEVSFGDLSFPCFALAKQQQTSPQQIAQELAKKVSLTDAVAEVQAVGPYLNFFAANKAEQVLSRIFEESDCYGKSSPKDKKIAVEFFSPNTHKAVHVGHVRNLVLGSVLCKVLEAAGNTVVRLNYPADIGPQVAKCLWLLLKEKPPVPATHRGEWLAKLYAKANNIMKTDEKAAAESAEILKKIYAEDKELHALWQQTRQWCLEEFESIAAEFGVTFDKVFFESEMEQPARQIAKRLLEQGIAEESEGAIVLNLEEQNLGVFVILTSDGRALYASKDLALALQKFKEFMPDESFYIVGKEQERHFQQVFASLGLMGEKNIAEHSRHIAYELVTLADGERMSSREGNVIFYAELREQLLAAAEKGIAKRHPAWEATRQKEVARQLALSSLKFQMINRDNNKQISFSIEQSLDFEGETGAYVLYAYARLCSLFKKYGEKVAVPSSFAALTTEDEKNLLRLLASYPAVVTKASSQTKPLLVSRFALDLAQHFNRFYHLHPVLKADDNLKQQRLALCKAVQQVLANVLLLLGMHPLEEM